LLAGYVRIVGLRTRVIELVNAALGLATELGERERSDTIPAPPPETEILPSPPDESDERPSSDRVAAAYGWLE
jgi:hypothetical protein